jgi:hypothetical protein
MRLQQQQQQQQQQHWDFHPVAQGGVPVFNFLF